MFTEIPDSFFESRLKDEDFAIDLMHGLTLLESHDKKRAREAFKKAVCMFQPDEIYYLGLMYKEGRRVGENLEAALMFFDLATKKGSGFGAYQLGCCYRDGLGVGKSSAQADLFFKMASDMGCVDAKKELGLITGKKSKYSAHEERSDDFDGECYTEEFGSHEEGDVFGNSYSELFGEDQKPSGDNRQKITPQKVMPKKIIPQKVTSKRITPKATACAVTAPKKESSCTAPSSALKKTNTKRSGFFESQRRPDSKRTEITRLVINGDGEDAPSSQEKPSSTRCGSCCTIL